MKKSVIALLLAAVSVVSCEPPMPPSDEEMIRHFATHEAAFRKVYEIMSESSEGSFTTRRFLRKRSLYLIQQSKAIHPMKRMTKKTSRYMGC